MADADAAVDDPVDGKTIGIGRHARTATAYPVVGRVATGRAGGRRVGNRAIEVQRGAAVIHRFQMIHRTKDVIGVRNARIFIDGRRVGVELHQAGDDVTAAAAARLH